MADVRIETIELGGGFWATFFRGDQGDLYKFHAAGRIARADCAWRQVVISGEIEMIGKPAAIAAWPIQRAGGDDRELPDLEAGNYVRRCNEDGTLFVSGCAIDGLPFESEIVNLKRGATYTLPLGHYLVLGCGELQANGDAAVGPIPVRASSGDIEFAVAAGPAIGVRIWR